MKIFHTRWSMFTLSIQEVLTKINEFRNRYKGFKAKKYQNGEGIRAQVEIVGTNYEQRRGVCAWLGKGPRGCVGGGGVVAICKMITQNTFLQFQSISGQSANEKVGSSSCLLVYWKLEQTCMYNRINIRHSTPDVNAGVTVELPQPAQLTSLSWCVKSKNMAGTNSFSVSWRQCNPCNLNIRMYNLVAFVVSLVQRNR